MSHFIYKKDKQIHADVGKEIWQAAEEGKEYLLSMKVNRPVRSIGQNKLFHGICRIFALYSGHTDEEIKNEFKKARFFEWKTDNFGREFKRLKSTAGLDTTEFTSVINNLIEWGREECPGCVIPRKEDMHYKMLMDIDEHYDREFAG